MGTLRIASHISGTIFEHNVDESIVRCFNTVAESTFSNGHRNFVVCCTVIVPLEIVVVVSWNCSVSFWNFNEGRLLFQYTPESTVGVSALAVSQMDASVDKLNFYRLVFGLLDGRTCVFMLSLLHATNPDKKNFEETSYKDSLFSRLDNSDAGSCGSNAEINAQPYHFDESSDDIDSHQSLQFEPISDQFYSPLPVVDIIFSVQGKYALYSYAKRVLYIHHFASNRAITQIELQGDVYSIAVVSMLARQEDALNNIDPVQQETVTVHGMSDEFEAQKKKSPQKGVKFLMPKSSVDGNTKNTKKIHRDEDELYVSIQDDQCVRVFDALSNKYVTDIQGHKTHPGDKICRVAMWEHAIGSTMQMDAASRVIVCVYVTESMQAYYCISSFATSGQVVNPVALGCICSSFDNQVSTGGGSTSSVIEMIPVGAATLNSNECIIYAFWTFRRLFLLQFDIGFTDGLSAAEGVHVSISSRIEYSIPDFQCRIVCARPIKMSSREDRKHKFLVILSDGTTNVIHM